MSLRGAPAGRRRRTSTCGTCSAYPRAARTSPSRTPTASPRPTGSSPRSSATPAPAARLLGSTMPTTRPAPTGPAHGPAPPYSSPPSRRWASPPATWSDCRSGRAHRVSQPGARQTRRPSAANNVAKLARLTAFVQKFGLRPNFWPMFRTTGGFVTLFGGESRPRRGGRAASGTAGARSELPVAALAATEALQTRLDVGQRAQAVLELVAHRRVELHPQRLKQRQAVLAQAGLRELGELPRQLLGGLARGALRHHPVGQPDLKRLGRRHRPSGQH